jgi:hypothetical protein
MPLAAGTNSGPATHRLWRDGLDTATRVLIEKTRLTNEAACVIVLVQSLERLMSPISGDLNS